jgi:hypothetical protein
MLSNALLNVSLVGGLTDCQLLCFEVSHPILGLSRDLLISTVSNFTLDTGTMLRTVTRLQNPASKASDMYNNDNTTGW